MAGQVVLRAKAARVVKYGWNQQQPYSVEVKWADDSDFGQITSCSTREQARAAALALVEGATVLEEFAVERSGELVVDLPEAQAAGL